MAPGACTQLFFLDEATAFAAGHRPCGECRRERYRAFCDAWRRVHGGAEPGRSLPQTIDRRLHAARIARSGAKVTFPAPLATLPDGTQVSITVRGVNHRFLDLSLKMRDDLGALEAPLRKLVSGAVARGHVEPAPLKWEPLDYGINVRQMAVPQVAWDTIQDAHLARTRGSEDALDGHALFTRRVALKIRFGDFQTISRSHTMPAPTDRK